VGFRAGSQWSKGGKSLFAWPPPTQQQRRKDFKNRTTGSFPAPRQRFPARCVDYIVTEYGAVKLAHARTWMRAEKDHQHAIPISGDLIKERKK
jgi:hypothetical protein